MYVCIACTHMCALPCTHSVSGIIVYVYLAISEARDDKVPCVGALTAKHHWVLQRIGQRNRQLSSSAEIFSITLHIYIHTVYHNHPSICHYIRFFMYIYMQYAVYTSMYTHEWKCWTFRVQASWLTVPSAINSTGAKVCMCVLLNMHFSKLCTTTYV